MSFMDTSRPAGGQVRVARESRLIRAVMTGRNGMPQDIFVRNLSRFGIGARTAKFAPARDEAVTIFLPGQIAVSGIVRWRSGKHFGVQLDAELELEIVSEEMRRQMIAQVPETHWEVRRLHQVFTPHAYASRLRRV